MGSAVGGIVGGLFGGSNTPSPPNLQTWQPTGTSSFDTTFQNLLNANINNNPYSNISPSALSTFQNLYNNIYAPGYQTAANTAGGVYGTTGTNAAGLSNNLSTAAGAALPAASSVLSMGFDPQGDLYKRTLQQLNDTVNVNEAQRGITGSPYGASVANTADANFNIDWQNNMLTRALQALSGYTGATEGAGQVGTAAQNLGSAGAAAINNSGAVPYTASNTIGGNQNAAITALLNVIGNPGAGTFTNSNLANIMQYLNLGAGQANQQANFNEMAYQDALKASQSANAGFGGIASGLFNLLNGGPFGGASSGAGGFGGILNSIIPSSAGAAGAGSSVMSDAEFADMMDSLMAAAPEAAAAL